jgi:hypothetical protein
MLRKGGPRVLHASFLVSIWVSEIFTAIYVNSDAGFFHERDNHINSTSLLMLQNA